MVNNEDSSNKQNSDTANGKIYLNECLDLSMNYYQDLRTAISCPNSQYKVYPIPLNITHLESLHNFPLDEKNDMVFAIDLGGTNLRVFLFEIEKHPITKCTKISSSKMTIDAFHKSPEADQSDLFGFIAKSCYDEYAANKDKIEPYLTDNRTIRVGFCFSFPFSGKTLNEGILNKWVKGFEVKGCVEQDIVKLLNTQLEKYGRQHSVNLVCSTILNDAVSNLVNHYFNDKSCLVSINIGTGINSCFYDLKTDQIINTESGHYTIPDKHRLGSNEIEHLVSGKFFGPLTKKAIIEKFPTLSDVVDEYDMRGAFSTQNISEYISSCSESNSLFLLEQEISKLSNSRITLKSICESIVERSISLASAVLFGIIIYCLDSFKNIDDIIIGAEGSIMEFFYNYKQNMHRKLNSLKEAYTNAHGIEIKQNFRFCTENNNSIKGVALITSVNTQT